MAELTDKEKIIKAVYEDKEQGFGSIKDTFKQAYEKDKSIKSTLKEKRQLDGYDSKPFGFQN